jgi:hypothetical protein
MLTAWFYISDVDDNTKTPTIVSLIDLTVQKNNGILKVKKIRKVFTNYKCKSHQISSGNSLLIP